MAARMTGKCSACGVPIEAAVAKCSFTGHDHCLVKRRSLR